MKSTYTISINTASTASDSTDWKSDQDKLAATSAIQPTVWDEAYNWGWRTVDLRPKSAAIPASKPLKTTRRIRRNYDTNAAVAAL